MSDATAFAALVELCARLRAPDGCPWDREQTFESLRAYIIEEAYEVVDAIGDPRPGQLAGELGDLLFQIVFVAQIAREKGWFDIAEVCEGIRSKMVRRHPHVFGDVEVEDAAHVVRNWETIKQRERETEGALAGVPRSLPALLKARRITEKAAALGFDWFELSAGRGEPDVAAVLHADPDGQEGVEKLEAARQIGEALFWISSLARRRGIDPEAALQATNEEFSLRFAALEVAVRSGGRELRELSPEERRDLWQQPGVPGPGA
ncbi:MAG: nucleoside triphosphate pyrophosphohydrolase [Thermoanaerobaculaceae bacterium]|jgi:MazG family protein|nr:nucleoside triphosphate pyrophosphohydrolase [Thermoanaerobaculaceae bacterium]